MYVVVSTDLFKTYSIKKNSMVSYNWMDEMQKTTKGGWVYIFYWNRKSDVEAYGKPTLSTATCICYIQSCK